MAVLPFAALATGVALHSTVAVARTTEKLVPVSAPVPLVPILKIQNAEGSPSSVNVPGVRAVLRGEKLDSCRRPTNPEAIEHNALYPLIAKDGLCAVVHRGNYISGRCYT